MSRQEHDLEHRARALYLRASRDVDPVTAGRLRAARRTALAEPRPAAGRRMLLPAGAFAVAAMAALLVWQPGSLSVAPAPVPASAQAADGEPNDLPPDADSTDPALYQDLQFYSWLAYNDTPSTKRP